MARREMGGHWSSEEEWEVSAMRALKRFEEKVSKYCKGKVGRTKKAAGGFIARGCGKIMNNRRKKTKMV